jgi:hypothetical protein
MSAEKRGAFEYMCMCHDSASASPAIEVSRLGDLFRLITHKC